VKMLGLPTRFGEVGVISGERYLGKWEKKARV